MEKDIVPQLLELIEKEFDGKILSSNKIKNAIKLLKNKQATYKDANDFAIEVGEILAEVLGKNISAEILPDRKMHFNIANRILSPAMSKNHELISGYATDVQTELNHNAGLKIKGQKAELNQDRIDGIINRVSSEEDFNTIKWILDEPIVNFSQSIIDNTIRKNAEFHSKAGLEPKIIRRSTGKCCDWCNKIVGTYEYSEVSDTGNNVFRRHRYCKCTVEYDPGDGRARSNVWTHKKVTDPEKDAKIEARKKIGFEVENGGYNRNTKLNLQLFTEKDLENQDIESLKKGVNSLEKQVESHLEKIKYPEKYYSDWNDVSPEIRQGRIRHWKKEISNFEKSIVDRNKIIRRKNNG